MDFNILLIIATIAVANLITRFLPYFLMPRTIPPFIAYISRALPSIIIAMLVIYCLKGTNIFAPNYGLKELSSIAVIALLHLSLKVPIISILGGVASYMILTQGFGQ
ncbi:branched-chain amino acid transporter permease [Helicobacter sp. 23-1045]